MNTHVTTNTGSSRKFQNFAIYLWSTDNRDEYPNVFGLRKRELHGSILAACRKKNKESIYYLPQLVEHSFTSKSREISKLHAACGLFQAARSSLRRALFAAVCTLCATRSNQRQCILTNVRFIGCPSLRRNSWCCLVGSVIESELMDLVELIS